MQCPKCNKTGFVTLSGKRYCSNCGARLEASATTMADIKTKAQPLDLRGTSAMPTKTAQAALANSSTVKPAGQFHGVSTGGVLDLRQNVATAPTPKPVAEDTTPKPAPTSAPTAKPAAVSPEPSAAVTETPTPPPPTPSAVITPKPAMAKPLAVSGSAPGTPAQASQNSNKHPLVQRYPSNPAVAKPSADPLPAGVAAQIESLQSKAASAPEPPQPKSPALQQALAAAKQSTRTPSLVKIAAAVAAIGIMSGIVWLQNSPKLAFHNAATQAGIAASLPTYLPSSYHQKGAISASPGALTINFVSPSTSQPLTITQRRSDWDSNALREDYVSTQSSNPLAVQGQGLTIYLFNDEANWINHGVWYQISGTSKLGREDVLKIAYGL